MKVLIVGVGGQGGVCASILARQDAIDEIRLVDLKEETAKAIAREIDSEKVKTGSVNAIDPDDFLQRMLDTGYPYHWKESCRDL